MPLFTRQNVDSPLSRTGLRAAGATSLLKRYRPIETRATGGFGSVEICLDTRLQRRVAIKRMPLSAPGADAPLETVADALAEARTMSMLPHPHIVSLIDFSYDEAYAYLVMEYVNGMSLEEFLRAVDGHSVTFDEAAALADALGQALSHAHDNGVLHLDIKPANVLIDLSGHVKLADFGMARLAGAAGFGGARGGTIDYMSPEQLGGANVDERSDVFSLACVLYEALCGISPFRAGTPKDSLRRIERGAVAPHTLLPDIPVSAEGALLDALAADPDERPESIDSFVDDLLAEIGDERAGVRSLSGLITRLTSDEEDPDEGDPGDGARGRRQVWELDPAKGWLGSRTDAARDIVIAGLATASVALVFFRLLGIIGIEDPFTCAIGAIVIGAAAGMAPALGSVLVGIGFLFMVLARTGLIAALPVAVLGCAVFVGWWSVWGRVQPEASTVFVLCAALAIASGGDLRWSGIAIVIAAYFLPPASAAVSCAVGLVFARVLLRALARAGALSGGEALVALANPALWIGVAGLAAGAAVTSGLLGALWRRVSDSRGAALLVPACLAPGIVVVLIPALANPMEIDAVALPGLVIRICFGALSSILVGICVRMLGFHKSKSEGDSS